MLLALRWFRVRLISAFRFGLNSILSWRQGLFSFYDLFNIAAISHLHYSTIATRFTTFQSLTNWNLNRNIAWTGDTIGIISHSLTTLQHLFNISMLMVLIGGIPNNNQLTADFDKFVMGNAQAR
jgi:hypothetical protein